MARPKKPDQLKIIEGTARGDRMTPNAPSFVLVIETPPAPTEFSDEAIEIWERITSSLVQAKLLNTVDLDMLAAYCLEMEVYYKMSRKTEKRKTIMTDKGMIKVRAEMKIKNDALTNAGKIAAQFGFTPAARQKLIAQHQADRADDPFGDY